MKIPDNAVGVSGMTVAILGGANPRCLIFIAPAT